MKENRAPARYQTKTSLRNPIQIMEVAYPLQMPIAHVIRTVAAKSNGKGGYDLPGGNESGIPVTEYDEFTGTVCLLTKSLLSSCLQPAAKVIWR
jgi:hypothetical protein